MAFTGQVADIPIGLDGLNGADNLALIAVTQLTDARNISYASGAITKEGGTTDYNASALSGAPSIIGGHDWWASAGVQRMVILTSDGKAYKDTGAGTFGTTLTTGKNWGSTAVPVFADGGKESAAGDNKLFIATGTDQVQVLTGDGASLADIGSNRPSDWASSYPRFVVNHEGRLWAGGNSNFPHQLYYSLSSDFENFTTGDVGFPRVLTVFPGEGQYLAAGASFKGKLIVWKYPRGIYIIDTTDPDQSTWTCARLSGSLGIASPRAFCFVDDDILFMSASGSFHLLTAVQEYGDVSSSSLSRRIWLDNWVRNNINTARLTQCKAVYYPTKREAHFAVPGSGSTANTYRIVWDFNTENARVYYSDLVTAQSIWTRLSVTNLPQLVTGSDTGYVRLMDSDTKSLSGSSYRGTFKSANIDLSDAGGPAIAAVRKNGRFLELVVEPTGNWNLVVNIYWDGEFREQVTFNMGSTGAALGAFVLGTDVLGGGNILNKKRRITGSGRRIALECYNDGSGEDFSVSRFLLHFDAGSVML